MIAIGCIDNVFFLLELYVKDVTHFMFGKSIAQCTTTEIITIIFNLLDSICNGYLSNNKHFVEQIQKCINDESCGADE